MANPTYVLINSTSLGASQTAVTFSSIPATYTDLKVMISARSSTTGNWIDIGIQPNGATTNQTFLSLYGTGSAAARDGGAAIYGWVPTSSNTASTFGSIDIYIPNYAGSTNKSFSIDSVTENNATAALAVIEAGLWSQTTAISSLTINCNTGQFIANSTFYLYGVKNA